MLRIGLAIEVECVARVRMLIQAIQERPLVLMSMLACNTWWMPQVAGDVCAICGHLQLEELLEVPCDRVAMRRFIEAVVEHCGSIQKVLKGYIKKCIQSREEQTLFNRSPAWMQNKLGPPLSTRANAVLLHKKTIIALYSCFMKFAQRISSESNATDI